MIHEFGPEHGKMSLIAIHMSQLRQPGDYLRYNRKRAPPPRIHTFTAETNQKVGKFLK